MDPGASVADPDSKSFIEGVLQYFQEMLSSEDLQLLLRRDEAWKSLVAEAGLSREEADALREALKETRADPALEDNDTFHQPVLDRERFLDEFPRVKKELEELIKQLHALANRIDEVHRDSTIASMVANSTSAISGILSILGLILAPVSVGISLALSATGVGLGSAAPEATGCPGFVERSSTLTAQTEAGSLSASTDRAKAAAECTGQSVPNNFMHQLDDMGKHSHAIKLAKANPCLVANAQRLMASGRIPVQSRRQVESSFGGTALAMTKLPGMMSAATAGVILLMHMASLVNDSMHLYEGAKMESAEELRQKAQELEEKLQELIQTHERLQGGPSQ